MDLDTLAFFGAHELGFLVDHGPMGYMYNVVTRKAKEVHSEIVEEVGEDCSLHPHSAADPVRGSGGYVELDHRETTSLVEDDY
jgi:hypothetical protein